MYKMLPMKACRGNCRGSLRCTLLCRCQGGCVNNDTMNNGRIPKSIFNLHYSACAETKVSSTSVCQIVQLVSKQHQNKMC